MSLEVHVRIRPGCPSCIWASADSVLYSADNPNTRYIYNKVHPSNSTNSTIFQGLEALVHAAWGGKNVTIMAYGQTGSGKTHSMVGNRNDPGIIVRTAKLLLELTKSSPETEIMAYFTEIYNETVRDLLDSTAKKLDLHDAPDGGVTFNKEVRVIKCFQDFCRMQEEAERHRRYAVTDIHDHSSRSHVILTFEIVRQGLMNKSVINLVDLAGSESASRANTEGSALREGGHINRSLLALGNVVDAIVEKRAYVPYRDAKLTRLLRTHLGGNGLTLIICCINPSRENRDQTIAALRFTQRAMKIKNDPVVSLPIPPLFTHQYAQSAVEMISQSEEYKCNAFERGLRDCYVFANNTIAFMAKEFEREMGDSLQAFAGAQRLLVAHDHAIAVNTLARYHDRLNEVQRQGKRNGELVESEHKRCREITTEIANRETKLAKLEVDLADKESNCCVEVANWQYAVGKARAKQVSEMALLLNSERAGRSHIEYEHIVCIDRIISGYLPTLQNCLNSAIEKCLRVESSENNNNSINNNNNNNDNISSESINDTIHTNEKQNTQAPEQHTLLTTRSAFGAHSSLNELRDLLDKRQSEVADLEVAYELVHEDVARARMEQRRSLQLSNANNNENEKRTVFSCSSNRDKNRDSQRRRSNSNSNSSSKNDRHFDEQENKTIYIEQERINKLFNMNNEELNRQIEQLTNEESNLLLRAKLFVRQQSIRNVRRSLSSQKYYEHDQYALHTNNEHANNVNPLLTQLEPEHLTRTTLENKESTMHFSHSQEKDNIINTAHTNAEGHNDDCYNSANDTTVNAKANSLTSIRNKSNQTINNTGMQEHQKTNLEQTNAVITTTTKIKTAKTTSLPSPLETLNHSPIVSCANAQQQTFSWLSQGNKYVNTNCSPSKSPSLLTENECTPNNRAASANQHERQHSSRERYAEGVRNALSVLNNLKSRLCLRRTDTPISISSESPLPEKEVKTEEEEEQEQEEVLEEKEEKQEHKNALNEHEQNQEADTRKQQKRESWPEEQEQQQQQQQEKEEILKLHQAELELVKRCKLEEQEQVDIINKSWPQQILHKCVDAVNQKEEKQPHNNKREEELQRKEKREENERLTNHSIEIVDIDVSKVNVKSHENVKLKRSESHKRERRERSKPEKKTLPKCHSRHKSASRKGKSRSQSATPLSASRSRSCSPTSLTPSQYINVDSEEEENAKKCTSKQKSKSKHVIDNAHEQELEEECYSKEQSKQLHRTNMTNTVNESGNNDNNESIVNTDNIVDRDSMNKAAISTSKQVNTNEASVMKWTTTDEEGKLELRTRARMRRKQRNERLNDIHTPPNLWARWESNKSLKPHEEQQNEKKIVKQNVTSSQRGNVDNVDDTLTLLELYNQEYNNNTYEKNKFKVNTQSKNWNDNSKSWTDEHIEELTYTYASSHKNDFDRTDKENVSKEYYAMKRRVNPSHRRARHKLNNNNDNDSNYNDDDNDSNDDDVVYIGREREEEHKKEWQSSFGNDKKSKEEKYSQKKEFHTATCNLRNAPNVNRQHVEVSNIYMKKHENKEYEHNNKVSDLQTSTYVAQNKRNHGLKENEEEEVVRVDRALWAMNGKTPSSSSPQEQGKTCEIKETRTQMEEMERSITENNQYIEEMQLRE